MTRSEGDPGSAGSAETMRLPRVLFTGVLLPTLINYSVTTLQQIDFVWAKQKHAVTAATALIPMATKPCAGQKDS